jgi:hypothetical protein
MQYQMIFHNGKPRRLVTGVDFALARAYLPTYIGWAGIWTGYRQNRNSRPDNGELKIQVSMAVAGIFKININ